MAWYLAVLVSVILLASASSVSRTVKRPRPFPSFEEYLNSLDAKEQAWIASPAAALEEDLSPSLEGSGDELLALHATKKPLPIRSGFGKSKDVTCCMLGTLAGDKGYHCYAKFYAARILLRNRNRTHNRKMSFHGAGRIPNYGAKLMRTFEQCVSQRALVFHKCCHLAALEPRPPHHYDTLQRQRYYKKHHKYN